MISRHIGIRPVHKLPDVGCGWNSVRGEQASGEKPGEWDLATRTPFPEMTEDTGRKIAHIRFGVFAIHFELPVDHRVKRYDEGVAVVKTACIGSLVSNWCLLGRAPAVSVRQRVGLANNWKGTFEGFDVPDTHGDAAFMPDVDEELLFCSAFFEASRIVDFLEIKASSRVNLRPRGKTSIKTAGKW
jgi:hypothetical protein